MREQRVQAATNVKQNNGNKVLIFTGLGLSAAAFVMAVIPLLLFLIPGGADTSSPLLKTGIYVNAVAVAAAMAGIIVTAAAKPKGGIARLIARLTLFFGAAAFLIGMACFLLCLLFAAIIPLHAIG